MRSRRHRAAPASKLRPGTRTRRRCRAGRAGRRRQRRSARRSIRRATPRARELSSRSGSSGSARTSRPTGSARLPATRCSRSPSGPALRARVRARSPWASQTQRRRLRLSDGSYVAEGGGLKLSKSRSLQTGGSALGFTSTRSRLSFQPGEGRPRAASRRASRRLRRSPGPLGCHEALRCCGWWSSGVLLTERNAAARARRTSPGRGAAYAAFLVTSPAGAPPISNSSASAIMPRASREGVGRGGALARARDVLAGHGPDVAERIVDARHHGPATAERGLHRARPERGLVDERHGVPDQRRPRRERATSPSPSRSWRWCSPSWSVAPRWPVTTPTERSSRSCPRAVRAPGGRRAPVIAPGITETNTEE